MLYWFTSLNVYFISNCDLFEVLNKKNDVMYHSASAWLSVPFWVTRNMMVEQNNNVLSDFAFFKTCMSNVWHMTFGWHNYCILISVMTNLKFLSFMLSFIHSNVGIRFKEDKVWENKNGYFAKHCDMTLCYGSTKSILSHLCQFILFYGLCWLHGRQVL